MRKRRALILGLTLLAVASITALALSVVSPPPTRAQLGFAVASARIQNVIVYPRLAASRCVGEDACSDLRADCAVESSAQRFTR